MSATTSKGHEKLASVSSKSKIEKKSPAKSPIAKAPSNPPHKKSKHIPHEEHYRIVAETAYFIAERRGFSNGNCEEDWYQAERIIESSFH